jgi:hypothetical protein
MAGISVVHDAHPDVCAWDSRHPWWVALKLGAGSEFGASLQATIDEMLEGRYSSRQFDAGCVLSANTLDEILRKVREGWLVDVGREELYLRVVALMNGNAYTIDLTDLEGCALLSSNLPWKVNILRQCELRSSQIQLYFSFDRKLVYDELGRSGEEIATMRIGKWLGAFWLAASALGLRACATAFLDELELQIAFPYDDIDQSTVIGLAVGL